MAHFPPKKFFPENPAVTHNFIWVSNTRPKFRKKTALTEGRTERRKDGQTLFYKTLSGTARGPKKTKRQATRYIKQMHQILLEIKM